MQIKELSIKNFKSFEYAQIPFKDGLSVIVGPNGSGKSNIIDSILFSLGTTSLKRLRVDKIADLVNQHSKANTARCRLVFEHDGAKHELVREIDNLGRSVFSLDDSKKTLHEITSFLSEIGISQDGYNTVQQGDVTKIISLSADERRKIIDDISGISLFDARKEEAEDNLKKVDKRLEKITIALNERKPYLEQLEKEKESAIQYKDLENSENLYNYNLFKAQIKSYTDELTIENDNYSKISVKLDSLNLDKETESKKLKDKEAKLEELNLELINHSEKIQNLFGRELSELISKKEIFENNISIKNQNKEYLILENSKAKEELENFKKQISEIDADLSKIKEELKEKAETKNKLKQEILKDQSNFEKAKIIQEEIYSKLSKISSKITSNIDSLISKKNALSAYNYQKEAVSLEDKKNKDLIDKSNLQKSSLEKEINAIKKEITDVEKLINNDSKKIEDKQKELILQKENNNSIKIKIAEANKDLAFSSNILSKKKELQKVFSTYSSYEGFLDELIEIKSKDSSLYYANYVVLKDESDIEKILKSLDDKFNINFVILSILDIKKAELSNYFSKNIIKTKTIKTPESYYFDGFCLKKIIFKNKEDLEKRLDNLKLEAKTVDELISSLDKEISLFNKNLELNKAKLSNIKIDYNYKTKVLSDLDVIISNVIISKNNITIKGIDSKAGEITKEISTIEKELENLKTEKEKLEENLKQINIVNQTKLRDEYDKVVSITNEFDQKIISYNSEIKSIKEKEIYRSNFIKENTSKAELIEKEISTINKNVIELSKQIAQLTNKIEIENNKKKDLFSKKDEINKDINLIYDKLHEIDSEILDINSQVNNINFNISTAKSKITQVEQNLKLYDLDKSNFEILEISLEKLNSQLRNIKREKNNLGNI
ncbi:MAG: AAA family ATPase, partial [archaeon]